MPPRDLRAYLFDISEAAREGGPLERDHGE